MLNPNHNWIEESLDNILAFEHKYIKLWRYEIHIKNNLYIYIYIYIYIIYI